LCVAGHFNGISTDQKLVGLIAKYHMKKTMLITCLLLASFSTTWAQFVIRSLGGQSSLGGQKMGTKSDEIVAYLPFFDDFSALNFQLDTFLWQPQTGVWLNNAACIAPPSAGVVSFDGLNQWGQPYNTENIFAHERTDQLTSRTIDLSPYALADSLYLSFFWQAGGLAEYPESVDSIHVEFLKDDGTWQSVWKKVGGDLPKPFRVEMIGIRNPAFLHENFQFRFESFGKASGYFDVWHIDYVYLDAARSHTDTVRQDICTSQTPTSFLKKYTAMPYRQFIADPSGSLADSVFMTLNNFVNTGSSVPIGHICSIEDQISGTVLGNWPTSSVSGAINSSLVPINFRQFEVFALTDAALFPTDADSLRLSCKFVLNTDDEVLVNDTIVGKVALTDFFALDDGSAEAVIGMTQPFSVFGQRFQVNEPAVLTGFWIAMPRSGEDISSKSYTIKVYSSIDFENNSAVLFHQQSEVVRYTKGVNDFLYVPITFERLITGTFYVTVEQIGTTILTLGYDLNTNSSEEIVFNINNEWFRQGSLKGALMLRPVFGTPNNPLHVSDLHLENTAIYPNPCTQDFLQILAPAHTQVKIFDLSGKMLQSGVLEASGRFDLKPLKAGVYCVVLHANGQQTSHRLLKE